jgi:hypothetical protein
LSEHIGFISGDLKAANVFVKTEGPEGFTCKIGDYGKSSCLLPIANPQTGLVDQVIRVYNSVTFANVYFLSGDFESTAVDGWYKVDDLFLVNTYANLRHMGSPYYRTFDFYTFIVSLLTVPEFYYRFFTSDYLLDNYWHPLWRTIEDEVTVKKRIDSFILRSQSTGIGEAIGIIKGIDLSCHILNQLVTINSTLGLGTMLGPGTSTLQYVLSAY